MGGNLFKLGRLPKADYLKVEATLKPVLDATFGDLYRIPRYYASKPDFGDMDIIVSSDAIGNYWEQTRTQLIEELNLTTWKSVGHVFSTQYMHFQVDYFVVSHQYFETTYNFMSFNDLGNILGKMFRRFNLKYGAEGLAYVYRRENGHYKRDLPVSQDMRQILSFLKLDYTPWEKGFDTLDEMFFWVLTSPYFSVKPFLDPSKTTEQRIEHRKTMERFVEWLQTHQITQSYTYLENRDEYLPQIAAHFPDSNLPKQIEQEQIREEEVRQMSLKFNGNLIMELTGLEGKVLGSFIVAFKNQFTDFENFLQTTDTEMVREKIVDFWSKQQAPTGRNPSAQVQ